MSLRTQERTANGRRRSQRIFLSVGVTVQGTGASGQPINEATRTIVVNAHGALLHLDSPVKLDQVLTVRHNKTKEELYCRVARIARNEEGSTEVGIEFLHPSPRFWRVTFPPADWQPAAMEVSPTTAPLCVPGAAGQAA